MELKYKTCWYMYRNKNSSGINRRRCQSSCAGTEKEWFSKQWRRRKYKIKLIYSQNIFWKKSPYGRTKLGESKDIAIQHSTLYKIKWLSCYIITWRKKFYNVWLDAEQLSFRATLINESRRATRNLT